MTDIVLKDIDEVLQARIQRVAQARGWSMPQTLQRLLEHGLFACEPGGGRGHFDPQESGVLEAAIAAMQQVPDDPGFALIGRVEQDQPAG